MKLKSKNLTDGSVTVVTPTYNRPELLKETIKSFINQDYERKTMIVVIDGYESEEMKRKYLELMNYYLSPEMSEYPVHFIEQLHAGCPVALNTGIDNTRSEYVCIIADDDILYSTNSLSRRIKAFSDETEVLYTGAYTIDVNGNINGENKVQPLDKGRIWNIDYINIQSMMWRRKIHDRIGMFSEDLVNNEDWEFKIKCLMECNVKALDIFSVCSRYHGQNKSIVNRKVTNECADILIKRMKEKYK